jgi:hypothetical protein
VIVSYRFQNDAESAILRYARPGQIDGSRDT